MKDYKQLIMGSGYSIYTKISNDDELFIPINDLEEILKSFLVGKSLEGFALRTRSKVVKSLVCEALGYPIPTTFKKTHPRFYGQNFDVITQKSANVQIWNEDVVSDRRYVFLHVNSEDTISDVRVIYGEKLANFDSTGTNTIKYQATMNSFNENYLFSESDTPNVLDWATDIVDLTTTNPNSTPEPHKIMTVKKVYERLLPMVGMSINYINAVQERNRGAELHSRICQHLGYHTYNDDGTYPDIRNQLIEIKLQTSPTIDLGLHSPEDGCRILTINQKDFFSQDIRYIIFGGEQIGNMILLNQLYVVTGDDFTRYFSLFKGKNGGKNSKIQISLPSDFFNN